jgi:hypothetical protein
MTDKNSSPRIAALQELEELLQQHRRAQAAADDPGPVGGEAQHRREAQSTRYWTFLKLPDVAVSRFPKPAWRLPVITWLAVEPQRVVARKLRLGIIAAVATLLIGGGALWWRLGSGPIMLDLMTPWLTSAIEQKLGDRYRIHVGGTQLERDEQGRTALRLRDITVRDASGELVATAPKAEVGIAGASLLLGNTRVERFHLVDANVTLRIDSSGRVDVMVGGERPFVSVASPQPVHSRPGAVAQAQAAPEEARQRATSPGPPGNLSLQAISERGLAANLAALIAWIDGLDGDGGGVRAEGAGGFDGRELAEIGITNGTLTVDDRRNGNVWQLRKITADLTRPKQGGTALTVLSEDSDRSWSLSTTVTRARAGHRQLQLDVRNMVLDDLLALRMADGQFRSDTLVSASVTSTLAADGTPQTIAGSVTARGGSLGNPSDPETRVPIGAAEFGLDWDINRRSLRVPFKVTAGAMRATLRSEFAAPAQTGGNWSFAIGGGWIVLDPPTPDDEGLVFKRVIARGSIDPAHHLITLEQGEFGTKDLGGSNEDKDITVALSGKLDYSDTPRMAVGLAGNQMSAGAFKRLWPPILAPKVREWVLEHIVSGAVDRVEIAANMPLAAVLPGGPPVADDALSIEIVGSAVTLQPVAGLPPVRDADMNVRVNGRMARVTLGKGTIDVSPGRRLAMTNGVFEVPDMRPKAPPATVRFRVEGSVPAAAELLALDRLREFSGAPFDPVGTRGSVSAQVQLGLPLRPDLPRGSTDYVIAADLSNFSAEKMLFGQRVEAQVLKVLASNRRYEIKGDAKIAGAPAQIEYRKLATEPEAEIRLQATLDEGARARIGLDLGSAVVGALPMKLSGRLGGGEREGRFNVEADLTPVRIDNLLPGWVKPPGRQARAVFTLVNEKSRMRFEDLLVDGHGVLAKGSIEIDGNGDLLSANFPVFAASDGDKATIKADRGSDGALRVVMRGDIYDGRNFVKTALAGPADPKVKPRYPDLDLDIKLGVVAGHSGEAIRGLDLRLSRRAGRLRTFMLNAKIGRDTALIGDMRTRIANGRPVIYFETNDAGALFRFTDVYQRMIGGKLWIGMDPPTQDSSPQEGVINVSNFAIRGEGTLEQVISNNPQAARSNAIEFSQARADFTRTPGRMAIRDGVVRGPIVGATIEGNIDYARDQMGVRGTLVPLYGINNMFGQIPIVGLFLGGNNEGIFGITYEVTGSTSNPQPKVNPISAIAPGLLRKFFEFRDVSDRDRAFVEPQRQH